jgi:hypothetical protein
MFILEILLLLSPVRAVRLYHLRIVQLLPVLQAPRPSLAYLLPAVRTEVREFREAVDECSKASVVEAVAALDLHWNLVANGLGDVERVAANRAFFFGEIGDRCNGCGVVLGFEGWADGLDADIGKVENVGVVVVVVQMNAVVRSLPRPKRGRLSIWDKEMIES